MLQPGEPVIQALRQDLVELRRVVEELQKNLEGMNISIQGAFQGMATGTGTSLRFLDARIDDLEARLGSLEPTVDSNN